MQRPGTRESPSAVMEITKTRNVTIVTRKDILHPNVGQRVGAKRDKGRRDGRDLEGGITPTRHRMMSSQALMMLHIWLLLTVLTRSQNIIGFLTLAPLP